ncbi:hypothetical protein [Ehrlichia ruminantium]|nr:hypothetical protein [Ehrlichia ruminantium]
MYFIIRRYKYLPSKKIIFNTHLTNLSQKTTSIIFSTSDDINQDTLTATHSFENLTNLQIRLHNGGIIAKEFIQAKLKNYTLQNQSSVQLMRHTQYISDLLNIRPFHKCYKMYSQRIIASAMLDELFKYYSKIKPDPSITYEIVNHLHSQGYEKLGYKFLKQILNSQGYQLENTDITSNVIHFTVINSHKIQISINTDILISAENTHIHNSKIKTCITFNLSLTEITPTLSSALYTDIKLIIGIPNNITDYITTKQPTDITETNSTYNCATMIFNDNKLSVNQQDSKYCYIGYKLPNPTFSSLNNQTLHNLHTFSHNTTPI